MSYCMYLRKSRADTELEARGEGETLAKHERILLDLAKRQRLPIEKIYKELVSGETIASRPMMQQLLAEVEQGIWTGVLVVEIERLARGDSIDQGIIAQAFKYSNTKIITPNKTFDPSSEFDEEYFEFNLFMSRREYKTINRRLQQGRLASVKEGKYPGPNKPYGYARKKIEHGKGSTLTPHPEESEVVKLIFKLYTKGEKGKRFGLHALATKLNNLKIPSPTGKTWSSDTLNVILQNPVYIGKIRWNSRKRIKKVVDGVIKIERPKADPDETLLIDGLHPAIIDIETFEAAMDIFRNNRPNPNPRGFETKNPLSGILECLLCGKKMSRIQHKDSHQSDSLVCLSNNCSNMASAMQLIEARILQLLEIVLKSFTAQLDDDANTNNDIDASILEKSLKTIETDIENLGKQLDTTHDLLEQRVYDTETFLKRTRSITDKLKELDQSKTDIITQIKTIKEQQEAKENIIPRIDHVINTYYTLESAGDKNELLKKVLAKVEYLKTERSTKKNPLGNLQLTMYPKINFK